MKKYNNSILVFSSIIISFILVELFFFIKNFELNKNINFLFKIKDICFLRKV